MSSESLVGWRMRLYIRCYLFNCVILYHFNVYINYSVKDALAGYHECTHICY